MSRTTRARLRIGELAERTGISTQTIRYYERRGLLPSPPRSSSGYRQYAPGAVRRLGFVRRAQRIGFSLAEIRELLQLRDRRIDQCAEVRAQLDAKLRDIDSRVEDLERMRAVLRRLRDECEGADPAGECPTLEALAEAGGGREP